jgi:hypothetical protein
MHAPRTRVARLTTACVVTLTLGAATATVPALAGGDSGSSSITFSDDGATTQHMDMPAFPAAAPDGKAGDSVTVGASDTEVWTSPDGQMVSI